MFRTVKRLFRRGGLPARRPRPRGPEFAALEDRMLLSSTGGLFKINTKTDQAQYEPATASSAGGRSVVVWTDQWSGSDTDIRAQVFKDGVKWGGEILVAWTSKPEHSPAVAMDSSGNFTVVWVEDYSPTDKDIKGAHFTADGAYVGGL